MRRPPITVKCECGESKEVPYGERWQCERCHRSWDTGQIPAAEYDGLLRRMRRYRLEAVGPAARLATVFTSLILVVEGGLLFINSVVGGHLGFPFPPPLPPGRAPAGPR